MKKFKWLHLSDFHVGKDNYGQIKLFKYILEHMRDQKDKGFIPDAVFITGDIANKGLVKQYDVFVEEFLLKVLELYGDLNNVYIVPGNHDLDRNQCALAAKSLYNVLSESQQKFFDANEEGNAQRKEIFSRFTGFCNSLDICFPVKDIFEEKGCYINTFSKEGKKIGIIGVNTAWLSNSDNDKEKLTPGKYIIEEALDSVKDCDYKFVLGHHPLSWFQYEQKQQISSLLAKNKAIYLHGHMHKNSGDYSLSFSTGVLTLQCGAAFQARENEEYYNSLQWGELNFYDHTVRIIPHKWSVNKQKFVADSSELLPDVFREEGKDSWLFPYTFEIPASKKQEKAEPQIKVPEGWHLIDKEFIDTRKNTSKESILKYFDGKEPSYKDIFSDYIPIRNIVVKIKDEFIHSNNDGKTKCVLLTGAGGEGKTTVLLQNIKVLVEENGWKALVLRQVEKNASLREEQILNITKEGNWIICVDNCFPISAKIFSLLKKVAGREHQNVHFLLCARDIDWSSSESNKLQWRDYSSYSVHKLRGIDEEDAEKIITAWGNLGDKGLGKLKGLSIPEAKNRLVLSSKDEENKNESSEGAMLGAMLSTRYGDELHSHVKEMLYRLQTVPVGKETLLHAFAYIVAMHSERLYFLSKTVMAQLYNGQLKSIKKDILGPLGDEAASAVSGDIIYTRHISIAQSARKILDEEFHIEFDELFIDLVEAAIEASEKGEYVEKLASWMYMSSHFSKENTVLAIKIDRKILSIIPYDPYMIVHLSKLYREGGQPQLAVKLFRDIPSKVEHRSLFCEWALAEANVNNKHTSVCLSALALSDQAEKKAIDKTNTCMNLYSIAVTFLELYSQYNKDTYFMAAKAAIVLTERIDKGNQNIKNLKYSCREILNKKTMEEKDFDLEKSLKKGILSAAEEKEITFQDWIPRIEELEYKKMFMLGVIIC